MGLSRVWTRALAGVHAPQVIVETHLGAGLPAFHLVGLAETEVREARERVRAALQTCRYDFPVSRLTTNLAPADLPKQSGMFDLAIALGILAASGQLAQDRLAQHEVVGELSLSGELRPIHGALPLALACARAGRTLILPAANAAEAVFAGHPVLPARHLAEVCQHLNGLQPLSPHHPSDQPPPSPHAPDLAELRGQAAARRALEVAASGRHSLLMFGSPGSGKSMLAQRLTGIRPPLTENEALESASILSAAGLFCPDLWRMPLQRAPHHSTTVAALIGGGNGQRLRPGEISLAHHQSLFLDELPEFQRPVLESLREPLETGKITLSRAARQIDFPADFQLIAAMNPCPCGYLGHATQRCRCTPEQILRYRQRLSGPLLDRIDLCVEVPPVAEAALLGPAGESSVAVRARVMDTVQRQRQRQGKYNAALTPAELDHYAALSADAAPFLQQAMQRLNLSARSLHRILRVARTLADMAHQADIQRVHLAEALHYRRGLSDAPGC